MSGQLEQSQYSDDAEELEYVRVLDVRDVLLEEQVGVEADGGDVVDHVHGGLEEMVFVGAGYKSKQKKLTGYETVWCGSTRLEFLKSIIKYIECKLRQYLVIGIFQTISREIRSCTLALHI